MERVRRRAARMGCFVPEQRETAEKRDDVESPRRQKEGYRERAKQKERTRA